MPDGTRPLPALEPAPFFRAETPAPAEARAFWATGPDGVRIRLGVLGHGPRGTVLCFPGRTEYLEKYGHVAAHMAAAGYGMVAVDWRGQGLSPKLVKGRDLGHVGRFADYQMDVAALIDLAEREEMPRPWVLLAHSMGGCIGLRSLARGMDVAAAAFSAPMWELTISAPLRPIARILPRLVDATPLHRALVPGSGARSYVLTATPENNLLTGDDRTFRWFQQHVRTHPQLALAGPTMRWLAEANAEFDAFPALPAPAQPCRAYVGSREAIVCPRRIRSLAAAWDSLSVVELPDARHEVLMERPALRDAALTDIVALYDSVPR